MFRCYPLLEWSILNFPWSLSRNVSSHQYMKNFGFWIAHIRWNLIILTLYLSGLGLERFNFLVFPVVQGLSLGTPSVYECWTDEIDMKFIVVILWISWQFLPLEPSIYFISWQTQTPQGHTDFQGQVGLRFLWRYIVRAKKLIWFYHWTTYRPHDFLEISPEIFTRNPILNICKHVGNIMLLGSCGRFPTLSKIHHLQIIKTMVFLYNMGRSRTSANSP